MRDPTTGFANNQLVCQASKLHLPMVGLAVPAPITFQVVVRVEEVVEIEWEYLQFLDSADVNSADVNVKARKRRMMSHG